MAVIVVYGGGFQPFHAGHLSSYLQAKKAFPNAAFYVAASNDTKQRPIPFDDKQFLAQQAGVSDPIVQTKNPINPVEILSQYNPQKDIYIIVRSERDPMSYTKKDGSPAYYQPFEDLNKCVPFGEHGYVFVTKKQIFKVNGEEVYSGTQIRNLYQSADSNGRVSIIKQLYPKSKQIGLIKKLLDKYIGSTNIVVPTTTSPTKKLINKQKQLAEHIIKMKPLLKTATNEQKLKFLQLVKQSLNEARILSANAKVDLYYVTRKGDRQLVFQSIPQRMLDKAIMVLQSKYPQIKPSDIEMRPSSHGEYSRSSSKLDEFAPGNGDDGGQDDSLFKYAKMWYNGDLTTQNRIAEILDKHGWEIGELESEEGGAFVVQSGDENGNSYIGWSAEELQGLDEVRMGKQNKINTDKIRELYNKPNELGESKSEVITKIVKDLTNPPKVMQHRAKRDQERTQQYINAQQKKTGKDGNKFTNITDYLDEK